MYEIPMIHPYFAKSQFTMFENLSVGVVALKLKKDKIKLNIAVFPADTVGKTC